MRADGKLVKNVDPMYTLAPYFMRERFDAQNMITEYFPYDTVHSYVLKKRREGMSISHMAVFLAAYVRVVSRYPQLNRFISNCKIYAHNNLTIGMVVLRPGEADPSMSKMHFDLFDTVYDVNKTITDYVEQNNKEDSSNGSDALFKKLLRFPGLVRIGMAVLRGMDKIGLLPRAITDLSPFHNSAVFTNLASIRTNAIYHHVYGFGTTSVIMAMGAHELRPVKEGSEVVIKKMIPLGVVMDERIASGCYYAQAFAYMNELLRDPALLEVPPAEENVKVDFRFPGLSRRFEDKKQ